MNYRNGTGLPEAARSGLQYQDWAVAVREWLRRKTTSTRVAAAWLVRRLKAVTPDQWFLVGFVLLLLAFFVVLVVQPSSVGRGGR